MKNKYSVRPWRNSDHGGIAMMPLFTNVPKGHKDWELVTCPRCGAKCWKAPEIDRLVREQGVIAMCTMCALKAGI